MVKIKKAMKCDMAEFNKKRVDDRASDSNDLLCVGKSPCGKQCESTAFQIEIRRLKSKMIKIAAELALELQTDDVTDSQDKRIYKLIQKLKST